jgi:hypothetical protein
MGLDTFDKVAEIRDILSSPHVLLDDTPGNNLPHFTTQGRYTQRVKPNMLCL